MREQSGKKSRAIAIDETSTSSWSSTSSQSGLEKKEKNGPVSSSTSKISYQQEREALIVEKHSRDPTMPVHEEAKQRERKEGTLMTRIDGVNPEEVDEYTRKVLQAQAKTWGVPLLNHLVYARRPSIFRGARAMWTGIATSGLIDETLQTLVNRRVAWLNGCEF